MKLVIAEKPSVALSLAKVLGATKKHDGYLAGGGYLVSWCFGHLLKLAEPEQYDESLKKWTYETLPVIPDVWKYSVSADKKKQLAVICTLMKDSSVDSVVCATDAGREGELIFRLVYQYAKCNKPFYVPEIACGGFTACAERTENKQVAQNVVNACNGQTASVTAVNTQKKTAQPPKLYDLTTLQRECNRVFGFTAQQTLDYLQSLYEKKLATYPRTDSRYLTEDMRETAEKLIAWLRENTACGSACKGNPDISRVTDNAKVSDHHAIIPTMQIAKLDRSELPAGERSVLSLIALRLLTATAQPQITEATTATLNCSGYTFTVFAKADRGTAF